MPNHHTLHGKTQNKKTKLYIFSGFVQKHSPEPGTDRAPGVRRGPGRNLPLGQICCQQGLTEGPESLFRAQTV